ncbi:zinc finger BED domain-containing protein RICESLEEPER 2-like [Quercus lobata]|uniref:zinc finger BED domain-containing protein RICESLEEPER 2-like n=1 Tax=Quercus lobata TaxID=97700 RepID=UPI001248A8D8|nr:zinc finger BED domain-containing protein RICESLEEPER 2-like [Quercus lobata]
MVITITVDNAKPNDVALDYLKKKLEMKDGCMLGGRFLHMRCVAHILNLIVQEGLKGIHNSIVKVRNAVRYVKLSPKRMDRFKEAIEDEKIQSKSLLSLDVPTRWNSTYLMLEAAEKFETAFDRMHEEDVEFISYFMEVDGNGNQKHIGPPKEGIQNELHRLCGIDGDPLLKEMAQSMKEKYEKYWGDIKNMNLIMFIAVVLDPRYKMKYLQYWFNKWYSKEKAEFALKLVRDALDDLYAHHAKGTELSSTSGNGQATNVGSSIESSASFPYDPWKIASHEFDEHIAKEMIMNALLIYVILFEVARDVIAIPVSTIASESAFSMGGRVLDPFRSSLAPKTMEALICAQNWLKNPSKPINLREAMNEVESLEQDVEAELMKLATEKED